MNRFLPISRRGFLGGSAGALLLAACGPAGGTTDGSITPVNGVALLTFARYPALENAGGGVVVDSPRGPLAVLRTGADTANALSAVCTHRGCTLEVSHGQAPLYCACHGAEFDENGDPVAGPAGGSLREYTAQVGADGISVMIG